MKKKLLLFILMHTCTWLHAQVLLTPTVVSPAGDVFSNGNLNLSFTVAEMTMVETYSSGNSILNQGFQNTYWIPVVLAVEPAGTNPLSISLFPNPCNESFILASNGITDNVYVELFDPLGRLVIHKAVSPLFTSHMEFPVNNLAPGIYSLIVSDAKNNVKKIYSSKISILH